MPKFNQYRTYFKDIQHSWVFKILVYFWALCSIYDQLLSQFIPEQISKKAPKAWEVTVMTGHLLPFWGWFLILAGILVFASFTYGIRHQKRIITTTKQVAANQIKIIGYAEFLILCKVDDPKNWEEGFDIKPDGVWIVPLPADADATATERAVLSEHPFGDLSKPALSFPCSLEEFDEFIKWAGMTGYVDVKLHKKMQQMRIDTDDKSQKTGSTLIGEINFNYLPRSPIEYKWKLIEGSVPQFLVDQTYPVPVTALQIIHRDRYAMDYYLDQTQSMADFVEFCVRFVESSAFYFRIRMSAKNGSGNFEGWLCYKPEYSAPRKTRRDEWGLPMQAEVSSGGWIKANIFLAHDVGRTFGQEGYVYQSLVSVRLRGSLSLSPIVFYKNK